MEEDEVDTKLPRLGTLGIKVIVEHFGGFGAAGGRVDGVTTTLEIRLVGLVTHLGIREACLEVVEPAVALDGGEDVGPDAGDTATPVEEVVFELRRPVVAGGEVDVGHAAIAYLGGAIDALQAGTVTVVLVFLEVGIAGLHVLKGEDVGRTEQVTLEAEGLVVILRVAGTEHARYVPCLVGEVLVGFQERLGKHLCIVLGHMLVGTILRGIQQVGRGVELVFVLVAALVVLHTSRHVEPIIDLVVERGGYLVAGLMVDEALALCDPVGVLHTHVVGVRPVLYGEVAVRVVTLIVAELAEIVAGGEEIDSNERVVVLSLRDHVLLLGSGEHIADIERHAVVQERCGVAESHIVTVHIVAVDDALGVGGAYREIGLVVVAAHREAHVVADVGSCLEVVLRLIV